MHAESELITVVITTLHASLVTQESIIKQWRPLAAFAGSVGKRIATAIHGLETRQIPITVGTFKAAEGLDAEGMMELTTYLESPKATIAGFAAKARTLKADMQWRLHLMHPENHLVHPTRSMTFAPAGLCRR